MDKSKNGAEPHGADPLSPAAAWDGVSAIEGVSGDERVRAASMDIVVRPGLRPLEFVEGSFKYLDGGGDRGLSLNRGAPQAEGVGTEPDGRVSEAAPSENSRGVEQPEARLAHNQEVAGSKPAPATNTTSALDVASLGVAVKGAADAGPDTARTADPSPEFSPTGNHHDQETRDAARQAAEPLPPWPWPCSPAVAPAPRGLFPHQRFS